MTSLVYIRVFVRDESPHRERLRRFRAGPCSELHMKELLKKLCRNYGGSLLCGGGANIEPECPFQTQL